MSPKGNCIDNGRLKVKMYYSEKFESIIGFIENLKEYIIILRENLSQIKRNEPGSIPNSLSSNLISNV